LRINIDTVTKPCEALPPGKAAATAGVPRLSLLGTKELGTKDPAGMPVKQGTRL
jgi:hypothetical protein